jgi:hypothetical protein
MGESNFAGQCPTRYECRIGCISRDCEQGLRSESRIKIEAQFSMLCKSEAQKLCENLGSFFQF